MTKLMKWSVLGLLVMAALFAILFGPSRIYGLVNAWQIDGQVVKIQPLAADEEGEVAGYLIKLQETSGEEQVFAASDGRWMMIKTNDWVRVNLYPAPPWSANRGQWQNAGLAAKLAPPAPSNVFDKGATGCLSASAGQKSLQTQSDKRPTAPAVIPAAIKPAAISSASAKTNPQNPATPQAKTPAVAQNTKTAADNKDTQSTGDASPNQPAETQSPRDYNRSRSRGLWRRR